MSTRIALARTFAAPGAFVGAVLFLYTTMPFGSAHSTQTSVSPEAAAEVTQQQGDAMKTSLSEEQRAYLEQHNWQNWAGNSLAVWVSVDEQVMRIIEAGTIIWQGPCATAEKGTGSQMNSNKTPLGWHEIKRKIGADAPLGQVFRSAAPTKEIWKPGQVTKKDLVLTRLLWLNGLEPGKNLGGDVDSYSRYIYIHGTNEEEKIGTPSSEGCVRLKNADVIEVFNLVHEGTQVLITEKASEY